jgi:transporter family-2 protein
MNLLLLGAALMIGSLLAVQASVNQQLNRAVGSPYGASTLQLTVASVALAVLATAVGAIGHVGRVVEAPWWLLLGGIASPLYITAGILLFPRLGALSSVGLFVTGQVFASLTLDVFGLLAVPRQPASFGIVLGAIAVLAGITLIIRSPMWGMSREGTGSTAAAVAPQVPAGAAPSGSASGPGVATLPTTPTMDLGRAVARSGWIALGLVAGAVLPIQGAINAQLQRAIGSPPAVGTISFAVATATIALVLVILLALRGAPAPRLRPLRRMPWWGWLGGFCAAAYVTATFLLIPIIGTAVTVALTVTGQQLASAFIDRYGWFRMPRRPLTPPRIGGLALLIAGSVLVQLA